MKKKAKILACVLALVMLFVAALCAWCWSRTSSFYSEKQHIKRVTYRAEERFLGEGSEYTGLEVYPLYNEDEKLEYMLIELQPQGFIYVTINDIAFFEWWGGTSMYTMSGDMPTIGWTPYRMNEGKKEPFTNEDGESIKYFESHFKVAGIENERRYILRTPGSAEGRSSNFIPAVKRGEQYLDLVDGELIDYEPGVYSATYATGRIYFIPKCDFNL